MSSRGAPESSAAASVPSMSSHPSSRPYSSAPSVQPQHGIATEGRRTSAGIGDTTWADLTTKFGYTAPGDTADADTRLEFLQLQLNCFTRDQVVLDRYQLLGPTHRRQGGALRAVARPLMLFAAPRCGCGHVLPHGHWSQSTLHAHVLFMPITFFVPAVKKWCRVLW